MSENMQNDDPDLPPVSVGLADVFQVFDNLGRARVCLDEARLYAKFSGMPGQGPMLTPLVKIAMDHYDLAAKRALDVSQDFAQQEKEAGR